MHLLNYFQVWWKIRELITKNWSSSWNLNSNELIIPKPRQNSNILEKDNVFINDEVNTNHKLKKVLDKSLELD